LTHGCQISAGVVDFRVVEVVTPNEIARTLGVTGLTFRNWLRAEKAARHPLLAAHEYRTRYRFTRQEAHQLIAEYRASGGRGRARPAGRPTQRGPAEGSRASAPSRKSRRPLSASPCRIRRPGRCRNRPHRSPAPT
jgi:hypothetical protein